MPRAATVSTAPLLPEAASPDTVFVVTDSMQSRIEDLAERREQALHAGSQRAIDRQHEKGKMLARERIEYLLDEGSFHELDMLARHRAHEARVSTSAPTPMV